MTPVRPPKRWPSAATRSSRSARRREVKGLAAADTSVVDLHGRRVVPGFNDAHLHFPGPPVDVVDLAGADSLAELQRRVSEFREGTPGQPMGDRPRVGLLGISERQAGQEVSRCRRLRPTGLHHRAGRPHGPRQLAGAGDGGHHAGHARSAQRTPRPRRERRADGRAAGSRAGPGRPPHPTVVLRRHLRGLQATYGRGRVVRPHLGAERELEPTGPAPGRTRAAPRAR